jgi:tetratricopeptide (TPR) repeat protein
MSCKIPVLLLLLLILSVSPLQAKHTRTAFIDSITTLDQQIQESTSTSEKARLYCFRARNYAQLQNIEEARKDYILALNTNYSGWILNEYGYFLYHNNMYELAYNAAVKVLTDFPYLKKDAVILRDKAYARYEAEYYEKNPPTIIMDTEIDPHRVTRHDLIRKYRTANPLPAVIRAPKSLPATIRAPKSQVRKA